MTLDTPIAAVQRSVTSIPAVLLDATGHRRNVQICLHGVIEGSILALATEMLRSDPSTLRRVEPLFRCTCETMDFSSAAVAIHPLGARRTPPVDAALFMRRFLDSDG